MSTELLLTTDIDKLGLAGDIVKVADGYARNFLVPRGLAEPVTESAKRRIAKIKAEQEKVRKALLDAATKLAERDLLYRTDRGYVVYDRFFGLWLGGL